VGYSGLVLLPITRPIPTKRELKAISTNSDIQTPANHKANPDEKGTERRLSAPQEPLWVSHHKANPDEKGTERVKVGASHVTVGGVNHKANPDEKGTERI